MLFTNDNIVLINKQNKMGQRQMQILGEIYFPTSNL
jgi:hypothetical protein